MPKYSNSNNTSISVKYCYEELLKFNPNLTKTEFGALFNSNRQNIGQRINRESKLTKSEFNILKEYLEEHSIPTKMLNVAVVSDTMVQVPVRGNVELGCGSGATSNADFVSDTVGLDIKFIRNLGGNPNNISIVKAKGDSMSDRIEDGDSLIVDESKVNIINGRVYAIVYDTELFCKQLDRKGNKITATSFNKNYEPFVIDQTKQFSIVGQVIGAIKRVF